MSYAVDFNNAWKFKKSQVLLEDENAVVQGLETNLLLYTDDIYFGTGDELGLEDELFEFIEDVGDDLPLAEIKRRVENINPAATLIISESQIEIIDDEYNLDLTFEIQGTTRKVVRSLIRG